VGDRSPGGYHDLESVFLALDFGDTLSFELGTGRSGATECAVEAALGGEWALPPEENLVCRAVDLFRERTGYDRPLRIRLEKRIPLGAGLGGGSSDAAAALRALDALAETALPGAALREMAFSLGSDVPFFLGDRGAALVSGRGERIEPVDFPGGLPVALVYPGFASGTAAAFRLLDESRERGLVPPASAGEDRRELLAAALREAPAHWRDRGLFANDFLPALLAAGPEENRRTYGALLEDFKTLGAEFSGLTGSGSACFGIFNHQGAAKEAVRVLGNRWIFARHTFSLARLGNAVLQ
jgi:4-diphosphocytidyl-2-C-methyl-D-erythritol kinase